MIRFDAKTRSGMTRRSFLQRTTATGLAAGGLGTAFLPGAARAQPKRGGTIRVAKGHGSTSDTLDPANWENGYMIALAYGVHGFLTGIGTDGEIEPELAESWEPSEDAATWRFKLREGATFHDGRPVTAEDVVASIDYHRGEDSTSAAKSLLEEIEDISAEGDEVVFALSGGNADFPATFADYHLAILPAAEDGGIDWRPASGRDPTSSSSSSRASRRGSSGSRRTGTRIAAGSTRSRCCRSST